jgi:Tfp pilus assembly protein PilF
MVLKLDPKHELAYGTRGAAYAGKGQHQRAIQDLNKAIELDPKYAWAYERRAESYEKIGETAKANADRARAAKLRN